jgi:hypothetical protein
MVVMLRPDTFAFVLMTPDSRGQSVGDEFDEFSHPVFREVPGDVSPLSYLWRILPASVQGA